MGGMRFRASTSSAVSDTSSLSVTGEEPLSARSGRVVGGLRWLLEVGLITSVFAVAGSWPVPDTNEAHYLTKARHAADPGWCEDDFFLSTGDAHVVFFQLVGPLAAARPLDEVAWVGRLLGWLLLAVGMRQVAAVMLDRTPGSERWRGAGWNVVAAGLFSLLVRLTPASGEWVIGGFESKVVAWAGVLLATAAVAAGRFGWAWVASGAAAAVHPVVGGWAIAEVACVGFGRLCVGVSRGIRGESPPENEPAGSGLLIRGLIGLGVGAALAALGVWPALMLSQGVEPSVVAEAARIQVAERLPHHLLPERFQQTHVVAHLLTVGLMIVTWAAVRPSPRAGRLVGMGIASLAISATGLLIAALRPLDPAAADQLLRFYWFRSADGIVPLVAAVLVVDWLRWGEASNAVRSPQRKGAVVAAMTLLVAVLGWDLASQREHWPAEGDAAICRGDRHVDAVAWRETCGWIQENTSADAVFLTPRGAATFTWWAERAEVVSWKNMPQDPESVVAWRQRIFDLFSPEGGDSLQGLERSTAALGEERVNRVAAVYGADYIVVPQKVVEKQGEPLPSHERVHENEGYAVYRLR
jgi:hypothetical protein